MNRCVGCVLKTCTKCGVLKDLEQYYFKYKDQGIRDTACKQCKNKSHANRRSTPCTQCGQPAQGKRCRGCIEKKAREQCATEGCTKESFTYGLCAAHAHHYRRDNLANFTYECTVCGTNYNTYRKARGNPLCSRQCQAWWMNGVVLGRSTELVHVPTPTARDRAQLKADIASVGTTSTGAWVVITCYICKAKTHARWGKITTCGRVECLAIRIKDKRSEAAHRRRMRELDTRTVRVNRSAIFKRDGYRCHICGHKTRPDYHYLHPKYPTLDHLQPISLGGSHTPENIATCCRSCNSIKSNTGYGDQLALIG